MASRKKCIRLGKPKFIFRIGRCKFRLVDKLKVEPCNDELRNCKVDVDLGIFRSKPGIYAFFEDANNKPFYIGQTNNLSLRINGYKNPGPDQRTNLALNKYFAKLTKEGKEIYLYFYEHRELENELIGEYGNILINRNLNKNR